MKCVCVLGSPRVNGNSEILAQTFLKTMESLGAETKVYALNKLKYRGCQACMACKKNLETCAVKDDLIEVLDAVREADVLVLASPVYYGDITAQAKGFVDRTYCYLAPDFMTIPNPSRLKPGKKLVFIQTQGHPDVTQFNDIYSKYSNFLKWYGFEESYLVRSTGVGDKGDVNKHPQILEEAKSVAHKICQK